MGSARVNSFAADRLRSTRQAAGLTQAGLARAVGGRTLHTDIWRYENGLRWPSPRALARLAAALHVDTVQLTTAATAPTLADLRQIAGDTQAEVAAQVGITVDQWATLERGKGQIAGHAAAIAAALGVDEATVTDAHARAGAGPGVREEG